MPPAPSSSSSLPTSPRAIDDLLTPSQQLTPSKSLPDSWSSFASKSKLTRMKHADAVRKPTKRHKRGDRAHDADASEVNPVTIEEHTRHAGRLFTLTKSLFLIDDEVFDLKLDEEFNFSCEFESPENKLQGQLYDIVSLLPVNVKSKIHQEWVQQAFTDGQDLICSTFHTRIHTQALHVIVDNPKSFATSASHLSAFSEFIGYKTATEETVAHYDLSQRRFAMTNGKAGIGDETNIDCGLRHCVYIWRIREGLHDRKSWALGLIDYWNRILFPNRDEAHSFDESGPEQPENDDDLDDIFDEVPSMEAPSPFQPQIRCRGILAITPISGSHIISISTILQNPRPERACPSFGLAKSASSFGCRAAASRATAIHLQPTPAPSAATCVPARAFHNNKLTHVRQERQSLPPLNIS
ncbi:hypothetical protein B0H10DRAFT_2212199 [Mycena sp. CBHHK59/15]|nr:hypothetical protein B0H10DRAFT_2212199 [Mycena sp. CBHHK59/15]